MKAKIGDLVYINISQHTRHREMGMVVGIYKPIEEGCTKNPSNFAYDVIVFKDKRTTPVFDDEIVEVVERK